ncbi:hypothetical protein RB213_016227 [Colletotrichum asianum]|uniref:Uncharacterized protein n=1 Tax=Colletotrichum asianum TaxID=702518 RepID=A0A8H3VYB7_9PEZI|nr:hypothetical protein GQ607_017841 [Colletotrichum asianum]
MGSSSSKQKHPTWGPGGNPSKAQQPGGFPPASSIAVAPVAHTGSAPMWNDKGSSRHNDFYRNNTQHLRTDGALNEQKMPPTAPFNVQYEHGKALDKRAERLDNDVKLYKATANPQGRMEKKRGNPDFRGNPPESHEWHDGAAERLDEASRTWKAAGDARQKTAHDFIGYDSLQGHKGHQKRIQRCYQSGDKRALAAESHRKAFA